MEPDTILIVEDHVDTREGMRHMLQSAGYTVETAANGREALTMLFRGLRPCVIVMDLMMPVMNGYEFRQEQMKHRDLADIPFIAYSAVVDVPAHASHLKPSAIIEKPSEFEHVLGIIRQHCSH